MTPVAAGSGPHSPQEGCGTKRGDRLRFFHIVGDVEVHLRVDVGTTLCGINTADCGDYATGPAEAGDAPEATCAVCVLASLALRTPLERRADPSREPDEVAPPRFVKPA